LPWQHLLGPLPQTTLVKHLQTSQEFFWFFSNPH
jgi:hypothetical protein